MKNILFLLLIVIPSWILQSQEKHAYGPVKENTFRSWVKASDGSPYDWVADHQVGVFTYQGKWWEARSINFWSWTYSLIPTEATVESVKIKFRGQKNYNHTFHFSMHSIAHQHSESGVNFFDECSDNNKIYDTTLSPTQSGYDYYYYFDETFTSGPVFDSVKSAVISGNYFFTLGIKLSGFPQLTPTYHIQGYDGGWSTQAAIDLTIKYTLPIQNYRFINRIQTTENFGHLILDNDTNNPLSSDSSIVFPYNSQHSIRTAELPFIVNWLNTGTTQKYNYWDFSVKEYTIDKSFTAKASTPPIFKAKFDQTYPATIKAELIDGGVNLNNFELRDPWRYYQDINGTWLQSNQFISYSSPLNIKNDTTNSYGGVFLDQSDPTKPRYSVRVPQSQNIGGYTGNFLGWSANSAILTLPDNLESPIIFKAANDTVRARYKGHLASSTSAVTGPNNSRKIMYDGAGAYHIMYESVGDIWYTKSTDAGQTWSNEIKLSGISQWGGGSKNPSLYCYTESGVTHVQVVWIQDYYVHFRESTDGGGSWGYTENISGLSGNSPSSLPSVAKPVVYKGWIALEYPKDSLGTTKAIAVLKYSGGAWRQSLDMPSVSSQAGKPAIFFGTDGYLRVVCEDTGSIFYNVAQLDANGQAAWVNPTSTNISNGTGRTGNYSPSIVEKYPFLYAVWEGLNSSTGKREIVLRTKQIQYNYAWSTPTYFGCGAMCNSQLNFYEPVISELSAYQLGIVWRDNNNLLWGSRCDDNIASGVWLTYKLNSDTALHPTLSNNDNGNAKVLYTQNSGSAPYKLRFTEISSIPPKPVPNGPPNGATNWGLGAWLGWNCVLGASTYNVQVSTTNGVNFASGIFRDQTGITITGYQPLGLTYDTWYYWRVRANIGVWTSDWSDIWSFKTYPYSPPSCPYVFAKRGEDFVIDNNILPQSEYAGNKDKTVTDYYKLLAAPALENGKYTLELREFERERSKLDQLKLLAVDHTLNTDVAVLPDGKIVEYIPAFRLIDDKSNEIMPKLETMEGDAYVTSRGDQFTLKFEPTLAGYSSLENQEGGVLLGGWVVHEGGSQTASMGGGDKKQSVGVVGSRGVVGANSSFTFRERGTMVYVPLGKLEDQINVSFTDKVAFDFASLVVKVPTETYKVQELNLTEAKHSKMGNVTSLVSTNDGATEELYPGETIRLTFQALPVEEGKTRSFILMSEGRYERIREGESLTRIPDEFQLKQSYPNPFNPQTTIRYELSSAGHVTITIYDVLGQEIAKMVNETQEAGYYEKVWDAGNTPSGIYYVRLTVADPFGKQLYQATNKLVVMK